MMTGQQKQAIRDMRKRGESYCAIAGILGLSHNTVKSFCRRENITVICEAGEQNRCRNCGIPLTQHTGTKPRIYCSDQCRYAWWNHNRKYMGVTSIHVFTCRYCGTSFKSYANKNRKYCGRECYIRSRYGEEAP